MLDGYIAIALMGIGTILLTFFMSLFIVSQLNRSRRDEYRTTGEDENFGQYSIVCVYCFLETSALIGSSGCLASIRKRTERFLERIFFR